MNEFEFIENVKSYLALQVEDDAIVGIGDDAAVLPLSQSLKNERILTCVDTLVEDVHFSRQITSFYDLGWKSLAVNISDIAAMGGISRYALISFAVTADLTESDLKDFYYGFKALAGLANIKLIGGDTVKSTDKIVVSMTLIGETIDNNYILRTGAKVGDYVCMTGRCGDAAKGLKELLETGNTSDFLYKHFNQPMPRFKEGEIIGKNRLANSMVDISDGLAFSLYELIKNTKLGISLNKNFDEDALYGGEDYELLFTVAKAKVGLLELLEDVSVVGRVTSDFSDVRMDGKVLENKGYQAF